MQAEAEGFVVEDLTTADWSNFAALVLSPGAPLTHPTPHWTVERAKAADVPVIGDVELFARALAATPTALRPRVVAITGTNGKSTTTALIGWVLKQAGLKTAVGGNIGIGVLALPAPAEVEAYVIEVSSYQLDLTTSFSPDVAILTNVSPDHLDRHGGMEGYVAAKARLFQALGPEAVALIGVDEDWGRGLAERVAADGVAVEPIQTLPSPLAGEGGGRSPTDEGYEDADEMQGAAGSPATPGVTPHPTSPAARPPSSTRGEGILAGPGWLTVGDTNIDFTQARSLPGRHNAQNAAFAYAAARAVGVSHEAAVEGLMTFPGLAHRMETVGHLGPVRFVNDSKATNADAARQALMSYPAPFWIAGGRAKEGGIAELADLFPRIARAYLIGEAAEDFAATLGDTPHVIAKDMATAVAQASADATAAGGDQVVLLSPACASFDQFPDFEVRGEAFRAAVLNLGATPSVHG
jgi:UDP-N-acetylmuramoylalanine--D-glutamate ligase